MNPVSQFTVRSGSWPILQQDARFIREQVFIQEQQIAAEDEWDDQDAVSLHFIVCHEQQAIATARLLPNNSIGRVAVLSAYRGKGAGMLLMQEIIRHAENEQRANLILSAQVHAIQFYEHFGFKVQGGQYLDCGIPHVDMELILQS
ncbi:GNAT family N-acetyltransferase [Acinetobacter sp. WZC-1]|uniref:GNAT family N-acetyltransferase n=1 Tax=Acinetobacter sp. WZC-1 TaxID=3459034 RepID=UPI00403DF50C